MKCDLRRSLVVAALVLVAASACGGSGGAAGDTASPVGAGIAMSDDGALVLDAPRWDAPFAALVPAQWPPDVGERPVVAVGAVEQAALSLWAAGQSSRLAQLAAVPADALVDIAASKLVASVSELDNGGASLDVGSDVGATEGDLYFVLNRDADEPRMGARVGALLRVTVVDRTTSRAEVLHARFPVEAGDAAVFAQTAFGLAPDVSTITVAPLLHTADGSGDAAPFVAAVSSTLARFRVANVAVESIDTALDPAPHDAATTAVGSGVGDFGVLGFGAVDGDGVVVNTTTYGTAPRAAATVGMLSGGLRLPIREVDTPLLAAQLAPGLVSNALALRGDDALAAYLLEAVLADDDLLPALRFHLREHLALRYAALSRSDDALAIISADIEAARSQRDVVSLLNALSIRASVDQDLGLVEQLVADTEEFVAVATGVLPPAAVAAQRLSVASAYVSAGRVDDARALIHAVARDARELGDVSLELQATTDLVWLSAEAPLDALVILDGAESLLSGRESQELAFYSLLRAELMAALGEPHDVLESVARAIEGATEMTNGAGRASVFRRVSGVMTDIGRYEEGIAAMAEAVRIHVDTASLESASEALFSLAFLELNALPRLGSGAPEALQSARQNMALGTEIALRLGRNADAAYGLLWSSALEHRLGFEDDAADLLGRAESLALSTGDPTVIAEVYVRMRDVATEDGDEAAAAAYDARAEWFGAVGGGESSTAAPTGTSLAE